MEQSRGFTLLERAGGARFPGTGRWTLVGGVLGGLMRDEPAVRRDGQSQGHATDITAGLLVEIDLVSRSAAKDLGLAPIGNGFELVGVDEGFEGFFALPLAEDEIAAGRVLVFEQVRIDMAGSLAEVFEDAGETLLELFGFAGEDV